MITYFIILLMISSIVAVITNSRPYIDITELLKLPTQPFRCAMCMSFWCGMIILALMHYSFFMVLGGASLISFMSEIQYRKLNNL